MCKQNSYLPNLQCEVNQSITIRQYIITSQIQDKAWNFDDVSFSTLEVEKADANLEQISSEGANHLTLADI